jgi:hypothetical protein
LAYKKLLAVLLAALMPVIGSAQLRDPTKPSYASHAQADASTINHDDELILSAILISAKTRRATLNGVSAKQGQAILNGVKIIRIRHNAVTVKQNGILKTLHLLQPLYNAR